MADSTSELRYLYLCAEYKNAACKKTGCKTLHGGPCYMTSNVDYAVSSSPIMVIGKDGNVIFDGTNKEATE